MNTTIDMPAVVKTIHAKLPVADLSTNMNTPAPNHSSRHTQTRQRRAAVAQRLCVMAPEQVAVLDWDALDRAPDWLALSEADFALLQRQTGAVLCAPALRLWIDVPRLTAARAALGDSFLQVLLAQPVPPPTPIDQASHPRIDVAGQVSALLQIAGSSVLIASLPQGPLRRVVSSALAPATASPVGQEFARSMVARALGLAAQAVTIPTRRAA